MNYEEKQLLQWWLDKDPITEDEKEQLFKNCPTTIQENLSEYKNICDKYFNLMPFCNISSEDHIILCEETATDFINKLFDRYVDDDTLVITSNNEHDNVKKRVNTSKNVLILNYEKDICGLKINKIIQESKKYKKVFVYIIGTQISNGKITPQKFFNDLKKAFVKNNIQHIITIDDVHGMFIVPRDYSIFDHIIFTSHALILGFDMGLLISKNDTDIEGLKAYNWLDEYYKSVNVILKRQEKLRMFNNIMTEYASKYLVYQDFYLLTNLASHIFSFALKDKKFDEEIYNIMNKYYIRLDGVLSQDADKIFLRFRAAQFIREPEKLIPGLELLESILAVYDFK